MTQEMMELFHNRVKLSEDLDSRKENLKNVLMKERRLLLDWVQAGGDGVRYYEAVPLGPSTYKGWGLDHQRISQETETKDIIELSWRLQYEQSQNRSFHFQDVHEIARWVESRKEYLLRRETGPLPDKERARELGEERRDCLENFENAVFEYNIVGWQKLIHRAEAELIELAGLLKTLLPNFDCEVAPRGGDFVRKGKIKMTDDFGVLFSCYRFQYCHRFRHGEEKEPRYTVEVMSSNGDHIAGYEPIGFQGYSSLTTIAEGVAELWVRFSSSMAIHRYSLADGS